MSEQIEDGGPAFPRSRTIAHEISGPYSTASTAEYGMSLRDYFASAAMAAMLSNPANYGSENEWRDESTVSAQAYEIADDMLEERAK